MRTLIALLLLCCTAAAEIQHAQTTHDKIPLYGTQADSPVGTFDPATPDETVIIPAGVTHDFAATETALDVLVRGTLKITSNLTFRTLTAVDGGTIEITEPATLTIRDMPIDTGTKEQPGIDPSQYGHGLLVINSTLTTHAPSWRQAFAQLAAEVHAGDETLTFAAAPHGWQAGDKLVLPDTRQPATGTDLSAQTETATIASVQHGQSVTLTAPVQFDHLGWHKSDGTVGLLPDIANLTQPIVIRSENPSGVRGHVFITAASHQDVEGVALVGMGRTTSAVLHSTLRDDQGNIAQIGTNQIGRYAWHHHHLLGRGNQLPSPQFTLEHVSVDGSPKWGIAVHGSHFGLVNDCAVYNAAGSGIVTEDPWVYGNKITNNIVIPKQPGSGQRITERAGRNLAGGDHWHDRGGLGLASAMNEITGNRLYCCKESIGMAGNGNTSLYYPKERGVCACDIRGPNSVSISCVGPDGQKSYPFVFPTGGNLAWGGWRGMETWTQNSHPDDQTVVVKEAPSDRNLAPVDRELYHFFEGMTIVHCMFPTDFQDQRETSLYGWKILGDWKFSPWHSDLGNDKAVFKYALDWKGSYRFGITIEEGEVRGYDVAYRGAFDDEYVRFNRCKFECPIVIYHEQGQYRAEDPTGVDYDWTACEFLPVNGKLVGMAGKYPKYDLNQWMRVGRTDRRALDHTRYRFRPWRDGHDLDVYHYEQLPTFALKPIAADQAYGDLPLGVSTNAELIARGTPIFGAVVPESAVQTPEFPLLWVDDVTPPCDERLRKALERIKELEAAN